jgi:hypothetical protein
VIKNFLHVCIIIAFLILIYIIWRSEIYWNGNNRNYYSIYYLISTVLIIFFIIIFYLKTIIQNYLIITLGSIIFTFYLFEGYSYLFRKGIYAIYFKGVDFDQRTHLEIYNDLKKNNSYITKTVPPKFYIANNFEAANEFLPLSSASNSKTIHCNESGYYSIYQSDRYGFNNPDKEWDSQEIEYLLVGDSSTHGACVNRPDDIASVLRILSKKSILNLGYSGNGPLIVYATLREYLAPPPHRVKKVLWLFTETTDLEDLNLELKSKLLDKYLTNLNFSQNLKLKQKKIDTLTLQTIKEVHKKTKEKETKFDNLIIIKFIKLTNIRILLHPPSKPIRASNTEIKKIIKLAKDLVENNNAKLYFIYLPSFERYKYNSKNSIFEKHKQEMKEIVNDLNISFIDIDNEVFKKEKEPLKLFPYENQGHYTIEGFKKTALSIYEKTN